MVDWDTSVTLAVMLQLVKASEKSIFYSDLHVRHLNFSQSKLFLQSIEYCVRK